jgi:N-methylhydantoinase B
MGVIRDYRVLADDIVVSLSSERQHVPAAGAGGGGTGTLGAFVLNPDGTDARKLPSAAADVKLPRGSVLRICTPSGAGYGNPKEREPSQVQRDLEEDRVSAGEARSVYHCPRG